ncbi:hypothetical protein SUGI_0386910 [Cryptomeria japonica]|nr:hypothetical protein SUGI_0386910 [Cryptomeria japonica]
MQSWQHNSVIYLQKECNKILLNVMGKKLLDLPPYEDIEEIYKAFEAFVRAILKVPIKFPGFDYAKGIKGREILVRKIEECIKERRLHPQAILMAFAIKFLTNCPEALEELRFEHESLLKKKGNKKLTWDNYVQMKFTHCVIKETLRLGNVAPCIFREEKQDVEFQDFIIPKGWRVYVLLYGTHLDKKYYVEPLTFNPWHWKNEPTLELFDDPFYMPFGKGARLCPRYHLSRFEIALFLHSFVTKFRWEPTEDDQICYFLVPTLVKGLSIHIYNKE